MKLEDKYYSFYYFSWFSSLFKITVVIHFVCLISLIENINSNKYGHQWSKIIERFAIWFDKFFIEKKKEILTQSSRF